MDQRTCTSTRPDSVIAEIEKFMLESGENATTTPLYPNKGRLYDTDTELLKVLDGDNNNKYKKRKNVVKNDERGAAKKRRCKAAIDTGPTLYSCSKIPGTKLRKATVVTQAHYKHKAKVTTVKTYLEGNPVLKKEVIDLTNDDETLYLPVKFARTRNWIVEFDETFDLSYCRAVETVHGRDLPKASVLVPEVLICLESCVDLTSDEENVVIASEKELANLILSIVFSCHKIYNMQKVMVDALFEIRDCVPLEDLTQDHNLTVGFMTKHATTLGRQLLEELSGICVRNFAINSFLKILCSKLEAQYQVVVKPKTVSFYLCGMLNDLRPYCTSSFAQTLLEQLVNYVHLQQIKQEYDDDEVIFTPQQLDELKWQIQQYHLIVMTQQSLLENSVHVKEEILNIGYPSHDS